tara:strand:+ start:139 stop:483 length:345 start_codon:yes stop_codon:yes gene_type:complete
MKTAYYITLGFVHNQQDALDISQEVFIRAFRKIKSFDFQKPFSPWFYRLLRNLCIDHIRLKIHQNEVPLEEIRALKEEKWSLKNLPMKFSRSIWDLFIIVLKEGSAGFSSPSVL